MDVAASPTLALGVLGASLLGSLHCAAMCGGFACLYGGDAARQSSTRALLTGHVAYHGGRLGAYAALGAIAGTVGAGLDRAGEWAGVQRAAGWVAGALLVLWGLALLAHALDVRFLPALVRGRVPERSAQLIGGVLVRFQQQAQAVRAGMLGLLTGLLPCGWLYAFVVSAAGTGSAWRGAAFMALFWLGTVPALVAIATGMRRASGALQRRLPVVSAVLVIAFGVAALSGRVGMASAHGAHMAHERAPATAVPTLSHEVAPATGAPHVH
jgi:sulfite exporter TauE/SafE